jgi:hypothetical protein
MQPPRCFNTFYKKKKGTQLNQRFYGIYSHMHNFQEPLLSGGTVAPTSKVSALAMLLMQVVKNLKVRGRGDF